MLLPAQRFEGNGGLAGQYEPAVEDLQLPATIELVADAFQKRQCARFHVKSLHRVTRLALVSTSMAKCYVAGLVSQDIRSI